MLLFPDPRPLVERLGVEFFRQAPECPGVYLMRDREDEVLYVGKAKNLRKRLASYRVANPDRMRRRHLRLLRAVERIELQPCASESSALAKESALLRSLRPRFNRAGTWPANRRFIVWRANEEALELGVMQTTCIGWQTFGPIGASASHFCAALARLVWFAVHPEQGAATLPQGWFDNQQRERWIIPLFIPSAGHFDDAPQHLSGLFSGDAEGFAEWILLCTGACKQPFDLAVRETDLETVTDLVTKARANQLIPTLEAGEI